ncbi:GTP-binding protein Rit1, partial [Blattella germanica]
NRYKHEVLVDGEPVLFEILDTCPKSLNYLAFVPQSDEDLPSGETLHWADGFLLVYAITDRRSFNFVRRVKQMLCCDTPLALVGNKGDMVHLRQVSTEEGKVIF